MVSGHEHPDCINACRHFAVAHSCFLCWPSISKHHNEGIGSLAQQPGCLRAVSVDVVSLELPQKLQHKIASQLCEAWERICPHQGQRRIPCQDFLCMNTTNQPASAGAYRAETGHFPMLLHLLLPAAAQPQCWDYSSCASVQAGSLCCTWVSFLCTCSNNLFLFSPPCQSFWSLTRA